MPSEQPGALAPEAIILGCGYCGQELARRLMSQGVKVWATVRGPGGQRGQALAAAGVNVVAWEIGAGPPVLPESIEGPLDVVYSVPTLSGEGDHLAPVRGALEAMSAWPVRAVVYWSATSVYGSSDGQSVDEQTPLAPSTARGQRRAESEALFFEVGKAQGWRVMSARMPGIYGPGRTIIGRLLKGQFVLVDGGQKWSARVHRDDVAMGTEALLRDGAPGQPYILTDGQSFQVREMVSWLLEQAPSIPAPSVMSLEDYAKERPYAASFWRNSNRYSNGAIAALPGFSLVYPSYREGLGAELSALGLRQ